MNILHDCDTSVAQYYECIHIIIYRNQFVQHLLDSAKQQIVLQCPQIIVSMQDGTCCFRHFAICVDDQPCLFTLFNDRVNAKIASTIKVQ